MKFTASKGRFEQVGGIHRAIRFAGADQRMHLVDEQDDRSLGGGDLVEHRLETLLELAAIFRAGDQQAHVEGKQLLVLQAFRHVAIDDALGKSFDDGGLADARLTDQHRVVLGASRQHLDRSANFLVAADHRVQLLVPRGLRKVAGIALESVVALLGRCAVSGATLAQRLRCCFQALGVGARAGQGLGRLAALLGQGNQQSLGGDERIAGSLGAFLGGGEHAGSFRLHVKLTTAALDFRDLGQQRLDRLIGSIGPTAGALDQGSAETVLLFEQDLQKVLRAELLVASRQSQGLGGLDRLFGAIRIEIDVHGASRNLTLDRM